MLYEDISLQKKRRSLQGYDKQILFCRYNIDKAIYDEGNDSMNIAVCDDEEKVREQIVSLIKKQSSDVNISSFAKGQDMLSDRKFFDICFLDIEMGDISGIELAKRIRKEQGDSGERCIIIFVTAFREYMEDAFDVNAFHYLVKPIKEKKFAEVFQRAVKEVVTGDERREKYILVKDGESKRKLLLREIQYIESSDRKVVFHMDNGLTETYARMYDLENELGDLFFRTHRCYIVNLEKVTAYSANSIQMLNGDSVMLAEKKYTDFVKTYLRYAKNGGIVNV